MIVRPMREEDAAEVARLCRQLGYPCSADDAVRRLSTIAPDESHCAYVAEASDGRIVGWVHVFGSKLLISDHTAEIGVLVVEATNRGQGVGRALMDHAERWARTRGCTEIWLRSHVRREDAHAFYTQLGYSLHGTSYVFRKVVSVA
jgi:GNAT superfamily N-acetyltransferase